MKRTIQNYRKAVTDMQKDFFTGGAKGGPPSSITMTSIGKTSGIMKREVSHTDEMVQYGGEKTDDVMSTTSGMRDKDLKDAANKVQQYLDNTSNANTRSLKQQQ